MVNLAERPPLFASALLFKLAAEGLASVMHASEPWFSRLVKDGTTSSIEGVLRTFDLRVEWVLICQAAGWSYFR